MGETWTVYLKKKSEERNSQSTSSNERSLQPADRTVIGHL